jgi:cyclic beta-1,2-glucan synthetase
MNLPPSTRELERQGEEFARHHTLLARPIDPYPFRKQAQQTIRSIAALAQYMDGPFTAVHAQAQPQTASTGIQLLREQTRLLRTAAGEIRDALRTFRRIPASRAATGAEQPRAVSVAQACLAATRFDGTTESITAFLTGFQHEAALNLYELLVVPAAIKLVLLEQILAHVHGALQRFEASDEVLTISLNCLLQIQHTSWPGALEPLIAFEPILRTDPAGVYPRMDAESRHLYRTIIAELGARSDFPEKDVAAIACELARASLQNPDADARVRDRKSHVGYYLLDAGRSELERSCRYRPCLLNRVQQWMHHYPDDLYVGGILVISLLILAAILLPLVPYYNPLGVLALGGLLLLLPTSQGAVELMNHTVTALLKPHSLPKLDFSAGIPAESKTLVAVPALLLNERQIHELIEDLEVRGLANQDPNVHYALLSDLPDSEERPQERDLHPLVLLAGRLIEQLNARYAENASSRFVMLHRHRIFNPRQGVWMGWERKRGKLMDLNRLLMGGQDSFPFKAGDTSVLDGVRYVLTLDADTCLPRDSVLRMVGAMEHTLHRAIIDPQRKIVTAGYGLLQPRVGITVQSAARSRLAAVYSGQTGLDIYSCAISDVYQDLYGEGIFTGKGIYEVAALYTVLERRFPQNALLSHDLIEGAYARAGLLSDVEVIDDYPSHYSAQSKRKHRWVRGDWQIARWMFARVPDENGVLTPNPISTISRWKIFDNLRRSLVEPGTFFLLIAGWFLLPGSARYWTLATLLLLFVPVLVQTAFATARAATEEKSGAVRTALHDSFNQLILTVLNFFFLAHQTLLLADAIFRSLIRSHVTGTRLLEWETAAEAEMDGSRSTPADMTLRITPVVCALFAVLAFALHRAEWAWILPILFLWAMVQPITWWLNRPYWSGHQHLSAADARFLRKVALRTWRYFARYSTPRHHGLLPDNVQEADHREAARISPTNFGLLLNARQAALVLGYLTLPEFLDATLQNLVLMEHLPQWRGHLLNWYTTETLEPIAPRVASSVDSGNFLASLWTLRMGTLEMLRTPLLPAALLEGLLDISGDLASPTADERSVMDALQSSPELWLHTLLATQMPAPQSESQELAARIRAIQHLVETHMPWLLPKYFMLTQHLDQLLHRPPESFTPESAITFAGDLELALQTHCATLPEPAQHLCQDLLAALPAVKENLRALSQKIRDVASRAETISRNMEFRPLLNAGRILLAIGYETTLDKQLNACYDLLASESRMAAFLAIAKGDIPQECWFRLGREHTLVQGHPVLLSWTGTMFEYLMPTLWMRTQPETLLGQSFPIAILAQRRSVPDKKIPWGISESGYSLMDAAGNYHYHAFGAPALALQSPPAGSLVIAPYASVLALEFDLKHALHNLKKMEQMGWLGEFGFYEAADYSSTVQHAEGMRYTLVRSWMAHHQGMSLLALANLLADKPFQRWFHSDPRVRATELLLEEKPARTIRDTSALNDSSTVFTPTPESAPV